MGDVGNQIRIHALVFRAVVHGMQQSGADIVDRLRQLPVLTVKFFNVNLGREITVRNLLNSLQDLIVLHRFPEQNVCLHGAE